MKSFSNTSTADQEHGKTLIWRVLPNILAFGIGLGVAYFLKWETTDLVWSLWLCSLVLGYLTLLSAIGGGAYIGLHVIGHKDFKKKYRIHAVCAGIGIGLFFLGFFSLHFCGFHAGHSFFLRQFFPIDGMPKDGFGAAFMNPPLLWVQVFRHLVKPYGAFLVSVLITERKHVFQPLIKAVHAVHEGVNADGFVEGVRKVGKKSKDRELFGDAMGRPYINVVRLHLLIFFFAFCHFLKIESFAVYAVVYFVYFFPWSEIKKLNKSNQAIQATS